MSEFVKALPSLAKDKIGRSWGLECCDPSDLPKRIRAVYDVDFEEGSKILFLPHSRVNAFKISGTLAELIALIPEEGELLGSLIKELATKLSLSRQDMLVSLYPEVLKLIEHGFIAIVGAEKSEQSKTLREATVEIPGWNVLRQLTANRDSRTYEIANSHDVAFLKVFSSESKRGLNEIRILQRLASSSGGLHFPILQNPGQTEECDYYLASWIPGQSLQRVIELVRGGSDVWPIEQRLKLCGSLISAYRALHASGVLHLDVHPDNIIVKPDLAVAICDFEYSCVIGETIQAPFGIERFYSPRIATYALSREWTGITPLASDEQYSLVALLFEVLTGSPMHPTPAESHRLLAGISSRHIFALEERGISSVKCISEVLQCAAGRSEMPRYETLDILAEAFESAAAIDVVNLSANQGSIRPSMLGHIALHCGMVDVTSPDSFNLVNGAAGAFLAQMVKARSESDISRIAVLRGEIEAAMRIFGKESPKNLRNIFTGSGGLFALAMRCDQILGESVVAPSLTEVYGAPSGQELGLLDGPSGSALALSSFWPPELKLEAVEYLLCVIEHSTVKGDRFWMAHGLLGSIFSLLTVMQGSGTLSAKLAKRVGDALDLAADGIDEHLQRTAAKSNGLDWSFCSGMAGALRVMTLASSQSERCIGLAFRIAEAMRSHGPVHDPSLCCGNAGHALALWRYGAHVSDHDYLLLASCRLRESRSFGTREHIDTSLFYGGLGSEVLALALNSSDPSAFDDVLWLI